MESLIAPDAPDWGTGATCTLSYYNVCTGWMWLWDLPWHEDRMGTVYDACGESCLAVSSRIYFGQTSRQGYGFTGTIGIYAVDENDCPTGAPWAQQPILPDVGWNHVDWGAVPVPTPFAVVMEFSAPYYRNDGSPPVTDHPAAGPTGPQAAGTCYPSTRASRSYRWTHAYEDFCPGERFHFDVCDAEILMGVQLSCATAVQPLAWGRVKALFR